MSNYTAPIICFFSSGQIKRDPQDRYTCISYAPTYSCKTDSQANNNCNDGKTYTATCQSISSNCAGGDVHENSLCESSSDCECEQTASSFSCQSSVG